MMARSRPRARIAALKVATRFAPEAVRITSATTPMPIPTAPGWVRRQCSETSVAIPTTTATTRSQGGCSSHVSASVAAPIANANQVHRRVDDAVAAAALLVGRVDHDAGQRGAHPAGQRHG